MKFLFLFMCTVTLFYQSSGYRVLAIFPLHIRSHFSMFEQMAKGLARRGHQLDVISAFPLKRPYPNYRDLFEYTSGAPRLVNNFTYEGMREVTTSYLPAKTISTVAGSVVCEGLNSPEMQKLIENPPNDPPYDLVLTQVIFACFSTNKLYNNVSFYRCLVHTVSMPLASTWECQWLL